MINNNIDLSILDDIRFGFLRPYKVAGMAEPWLEKLKPTFELLKSNGIGAVLTLTEDDLYGKYYKAAGFLHHHEPINDCEAPDKKGMDRAISFINSSLGKGHGVAVHCLEGRGRTGTVLCAWLALKESLGAEKAIKRIYDLRECTVITDEQREFLLGYIKKK
ncbi:MAG: dual specificity protein phosphatase family protein [Spirochaetes bacterium]|jgi:atypical dual specificity phosphatase|nr:dual specificity protein phosphatase family protein [Spirochaetota bacterium]